MFDRIKKAGKKKRSRKEMCRRIAETMKEWSGTMAAVLILVSVSGYGTASAEQSLLQQGIAEEVLRFHVIANSDSGTDQEVKLQVRDGLLKWVDKKQNYKLANYKEIKNTNAAEAQEDNFRKNTVIKDVSLNKESMIEWIQRHLKELETVTDQILEKQGMNYRASAEIVRCYFPERTYGAYTFPAGWYDALRIKLGKAQGQNWWCVLYPRLCFSDCLHAVVEENQKKELEEVLTVEEYERLLQKPQRWKLAFRWF